MSVAVRITRSPTLKISLSKPTLKLKVLPHFPSGVSGTGGISVTNVGGNYVISPDAGVIGDISGPGTAALVAGQLAIFSDSHHIAGSGVSALSFLSSAVGVVLDGGGGPIPTGYWASMQVPFACTISKSTLLSDAVGNLVMDIKKTTFAGYPTATSIVAAAPPTLASAQSAQDTTLTGWTVSLAQGDILEFYVTSGNVNKATLSLQLLRA